MRNTLNFIRSIAPDFLKKLGEDLYAYLPFSVRYGKVYRETLRFLQSSQKWSQSDIEAFQIAAFRDLVAHASQHVPYYRRIFNEHSVVASDISTYEHIRQVPLLDKQTLRDHREELKAENHSESSFQYHTTGGSTAHPVGLYWEAARTVPMEKAFMQRQFGWVGYNFAKDKVANIRGIRPKKGKPYEVVAGRELRMSSYLMTPEQMDIYVDAIRKFAPPVIQAYPSSALILANHLRENNVVLPSIKLVLCGSEQLFDWQRRVIEEGFRAPLHTWYGQSEYVAFASECEDSSEYHFHPEYGLAEIIRPDGSAAGPGEKGEIIGTSFLNNAFPLIRYRTEDIATVSPQESCSCGRPYLRVSRIDGRIQEMIVGRQGNLVSMTAINMHDDTFDSLRQFQFYQDAPGKLSLHIVPNSSYNSLEHDKIMHAITDKLGDPFDLTIKVVDQVEYSSRGKTRFLVQKLKLDPIWSPED